MSGSLEKAKEERALGNASSLREEGREGGSESAISRTMRVEVGLLRSDARLEFESSKCGFKRIESRKKIET